MGSMMHIGMHAFGKITLVFCAGAIFVATGKKYVSEMAGIGKRMPITMFAFIIGSLSVIGLPPTGGFISKWYLVTGTVEADQIVFLIVFLASTILNAAYFLPIVYSAFFKLPEGYQTPERFDEGPWFCVVPLGLTALVTLILFIKPQVFMSLANLANLVAK